MIRLTDPARIGPALAEIRNLLGLTRRGVAVHIAAATGRSIQGVTNQLKDWDTSVNAPNASSLGPYLVALGYDLALVPRQDANQETA